MNVDLNSTSGIPFSSNIFSENKTNPLVISVLVVIIMIYYLFFVSLGGKPSTGENITKEVSTLEIILWGLFIILIILNGVEYLTKSDISADLSNIVSEVPELGIKINNNDNDNKKDDSSQSMKIEKEVFHISDNKYTYDDAKAVCKAYDAELANYKQIKEAHESGADWCGYGWSDDQMIFYPTQYEKWTKLQKIKGHEHDCGRPGINGGYIGNPNARFGVNCYGYKPDINSEEKLLMQNSTLFPKTKKEIKFDKKVAKYKNNVSDILISPFNNKSWSILSFSNLF